MINRNQIRLFFLGLYIIVFSFNGLSQTRKAPAYPLITHDPYFSVWSFTDSLNTSPTRHWTGTEQPLSGYLKVDDLLYQFMGSEEKAYEVLVPSSEEAEYSVRYTETNRSGNWQDPSFSDTVWQTGNAPFGNDNSWAKTRWQTKDLWVRREFNYKANKDEPLFLKLNYDDNIEVYLNGTKVYERVGWVHKYIFLPVDRSLLKDGKNLLALYIKNTAGGQHLDFGLVTEKKPLHNDDVKKADQKNVTVKATQTIYEFSCGPVNLTATFTSPLVINDIALMTRPVSYLNFDVKSKDAKAHKISLMVNVSTNLAVNTTAQVVETDQYNSGNLKILKAGTKSQEVLQKKGDDLRIDWGYLYVAAPNTGSVSQSVSSTTNEVLSFGSNSSLSITDAKQSGRNLSLNTLIHLGNTANSSARILIGYDDIYSIQYFGQNLRPWWNRNGNTTIEKQLQAAHTDYASTINKCKLINSRIFNDALNAGGEEYARLCEMVYRQTIAAHKVVQSPQGELLFLSKENFSNGSINTVDLTYPSSPLFLVYNPDLLKGMMNGIFYYSESGKWKKPFAAHDLGTYPIANGQTYGEDMPVEEAGNMVCLAAAIAKVEGNASYAKKHWATLTTWVDYLFKEGFDPANQLCTDDFAGHLARNANLSLKAIMAIESYAMLAKMLGQTASYTKYHNLAKSMVPKWIALANDGDHYSLAFEAKNTWSQKYNMIWDKVLKFNIFPKEVMQKEIKYYLSKQNEFGLPLDNRRTYTKNDWIIWTATMTKDLNEFKKFINPVYKFALESPTRVPFSDWYETTNGSQVGFQARSVVGGLYMKVLDKKLNK